eukprot:13102573-Heterocapsa_arctica.AAC.1
MLLADGGIGVVNALGASARRSTEAQRRWCGNCLIAEIGDTTGLMRKPADCVASQMLKAMGPGRQYERTKKVLESRDCQWLMLDSGLARMSEGLRAYCADAGGRHEGQ